MKEKVVSYIRNFPKCISFTATTGETKDFLSNVPKRDIPITTLHTDHCDPTDRQGKWKKHICISFGRFFMIMNVFGIVCITVYSKDFAGPIFVNLMEIDKCE